MSSTKHKKHCLSNQRRFTFSLSFRESYNVYWIHCAM